jgi:CRP-like cAMP-binding protein
MGCIKSKEEQSARVLDLSGQPVVAGEEPAEGAAWRGAKGARAAGGTGAGRGGSGGSGSRCGSGSGGGPSSDAAWAAAEPAGERDILTLRGLALFAGLGDSTLLRAARALVRVTFPANVVVYREGDVNDRFFILGNGEAVLTFKDHRGFNIELREMIAGDFVNEQALFSRARAHCTTLSTMSDCVFYVLDKRRVAAFARSLPELSRELEASCRDRESMTDALSGIAAFKTLRPDKREVLLEFCEVKKYAPGHVVVEQGKEAFRRCFFIIVSGSVDVLVDGKHLRTLGKHSYFGDVSVMSLEPTYRATIQVSRSEPVVVMEIERDDFLALLDDEDAVLSEFSLRVAGSRCHLRDLLQHPLGRAAFERHLQKEFSAEHIEFWLAVEQFEGLQHTLVRKRVLRSLGITPEQVTVFKSHMQRSMATVIAKNHLAPISPMQINVSGSVASHVVERVKRGDFSWDMFGQAKQQVYEMLHADNFARFHQSQEFAQLLKDVGAYDTNLETTVLTRKHNDTGGAVKKPLNMTRLRVSLEREGIVAPNGQRRLSIVGSSSDQLRRKDGSGRNLLEKLEQERDSNASNASTPSAFV